MARNNIQHDEFEDEYDDEYEEEFVETAGRFRLLPIVLGLSGCLGVAGLIWFAYAEGLKQGSEQSAPLILPVKQAKIIPQDRQGLEIPHRDAFVYNVLDGQENDKKIERILTQDETVQSRINQQPEPLPKLVALPQESPPRVTDLQTSNQSAQVQQVQPLTLPPIKTEPAQPAAQVATAKPIAPPSTQTQTQSPSGQWHIQIAALRTQNAGVNEWNRLAKQLPDIFNSLTLRIQPVNSNGATLYRIQGGPLASREEASSVCTSLKEKNIGCFLVRPQ